jgi:hypothetical protein
VSGVVGWFPIRGEVMGSMADSATVSPTNATRSAVEGSVDAWQQGARGVSTQVELLSQWPTGDLGQAWDRYFEYLRQGLDVNQELIRRWVDGLTGVVDAGRGQLTAAADAVFGHGQAIESWLRDETELAEETARDQSDRVERGERELARRGQGHREQDKRGARPGR